jgi:hypothetical protein
MYFFPRRIVEVTLLGRLTRSWVERDLQGGDLSCLRDFALFRNRRPASAVIDRLCGRRFMAKTIGMRPRTTLKGWIAVLLRHTIARRDRTETLDA